MKCCIQRPSTQLVRSVQRQKTHVVIDDCGIIKCLCHPNDTTVAAYCRMVIPYMNSGIKVIVVSSHLVRHTRNNKKQGTYSSDMTMNTDTDTEVYLRVCVSHTKSHS